jgi:hypothetical protein
MAVQSSTSYSLTHGAAYEGMLVDQQLSNIISRLNKSETATIPFGRAVVTDGDDGAKLPTGSSTNLNVIGITVRELNRAYKDNDETFGAVPNRDFAIVTMGVVYVKPVVAVTKDDLVYVVLANGTFTNVAGGAVAITDAKWASSSDANGFAKISLGLRG